MFIIFFFGGRLKGICKCVSLRLIVLLISTVICTCLLYCSRANKMMMMMMVCLDTHSSVVLFQFSVSVVLRRSVSAVGVCGRCISAIHSDRHGCDKHRTHTRRQLLSIHAPATPPPQRRRAAAYTLSRPLGRMSATARSCLPLPWLSGPGH